MEFTTETQARHSRDLTAMAGEAPVDIMGLPDGWTCTFRGELAAHRVAWKFKDSPYIRLTFNKGTQLWVVSVGNRA